ncbi:hypothetical protein HII12_005491 [Brettanomyces bruxellensis]|uniref:Uncharacterized protein n=1 Tax=Dekkera bruxellensis TaxID=5007 RepID=A0A8H6B712_DEKBR|nr:hypothetical protein HII12_005491 [Brettanomyces bruxellensis]
MQSTPVKRKRGRPSKHRENRVGESTLPIEITSPLNASNNSAAVVRQGVCSSPVMKLKSPKRKRRTQSNSSSNNSSKASTPKKAKSATLSFGPPLVSITEGAPANSAGQPARETAAPVSPTPNPRGTLPGERFAIPPPKFIPPATLLRGGPGGPGGASVATTGALDSYYNRTPQRSTIVSSRNIRSSPLSTMSGSERSTPLKTSPVKYLASSPLRTSPLSNYEIAKAKANVVQLGTSALTYGSLLELSAPSLSGLPSLTVPSALNAPPLSSTSTSNVNPSLLQSSPMTHVSTREHAQTASSPLQNARKVPSTPKTTKFSAILNSSPMYTHWYSQTPAQTTLVSSPGSTLPQIAQKEPAYIGGLQITSSKSISAPVLPSDTTKKTLRKTQSMPEPDFPVPAAIKRTKFLPANFKLSLKIDSFGRASVDFQRFKASAPSMQLQPQHENQSQPQQLHQTHQQQQQQGQQGQQQQHELQNTAYKSTTPTVTGLKYGVDPFVSGISSNAFDSVPAPQTPTKSPYDPSQPSYMPRDMDQLMFTSPGPHASDLCAKESELTSENLNQKYDARFAVQAMLKQLS